MYLLRLSLASPLFACWGAGPDPDPPPPPPPPPPLLDVAIYVYTSSLSKPLPFQPSSTVHNTAPASIPRSRHRYCKWILASASPKRSKHKTQSKRSSRGALAPSVPCPPLRRPRGDRRIGTAQPCCGWMYGWMFFRVLGRFIVSPAGYAFDLAVFRYLLTSF